MQIKLLGNAKKVISNDIIAKASSIGELLDILEENGFDINDLIIAVNGIEISLLDKDTMLKDDDTITIASIVHGG